MNVLLLSRKDSQRRSQAFQQAFTLIRDVLPACSQLDIPDVQSWKIFDTYAPQILSLESYWLWKETSLQRTPIDFVQVLSDMGTYMWHSGRFREGMATLEKADLVLTKEGTPISHPLRSNIYALLGIMSSFQGISQRQHSLDLRGKAIEAREAFFRAIPSGQVTLNDEIRRWNVQSDLAFAKCQDEDFDTAKVIIDKCLERYRRWGAEEDIPFEYAKYNQIMGYYYMAHGDQASSIRAIEHCVRLAVKAADSMHPMVQLMQFCAANLKYHAGDVRESLRLNEEVLHDRRIVLGECNQFTLESYSTCGRLLWELHEYDKAL